MNPNHNTMRDTGPDTMPGVKLTEAELDDLRAQNVAAGMTDEERRSIMERQMKDMQNMAAFPGGDMQGRYTDHSTEFDNIYNDEDMQEVSFLDVFRLVVPFGLMVAAAVGGWFWLRG